MTKRRSQGITLIELLVSLALTGIIIAGLAGVMSQTIATSDSVSQKNELTTEARFAMDRIHKAITHSSRLLLPLQDQSSSDWFEHIREQTVPATTPIDSSTLYTAILAVALPYYVDLDGNGISDADDDADGRIDEDLPADNHADGASGIYMLDDNGDGSIDEFANEDDDESNSEADEDILDGVDNDNDNSIDEDPGSDVNGDGCPGICRVDDDGDGQVDEGNQSDDDEDGRIDEDPYNPLVFFLEGSELRERIPVPWDTDGSGGIDGRDFLVTTIAENVTYFRVERVPLTGGGVQLVHINIELTSPVNQEAVSLHTAVRVGAAL